MRTPAYEKKIAAVVAAQDANNMAIVSRIGKLEAWARWNNVATWLWVAVCLLRAAIWLLERAR